MRAECHGELSKTCSGSPLHLVVAPNDEQGEGGGFAVQQGVTFLVIKLPTCFLYTAPCKSAYILVTLV